MISLILGAGLLVCLVFIRRMRGAQGQLIVDVTRVRAEVQGLKAELAAQYGIHIIDR